MNTLTQPTGHDRLALRRAILRYSATSYFIALAVVIVVLLIWWALLRRILNFGRTRDYSAFDSLGPEVLGWVQKYNPFFWWALVILASIFILYFLYSFVRSLHRRTQQRSLSAHHMQQLFQQLSPASIEVLDWVWNTRRDPITVGVLQHTLLALRLGRYQKIRLCQEHERLLTEALTPEDKVRDTETLHTF